jgi:hypothetical protein
MKVIPLYKPLIFGVVLLVREREWVSHKPFFSGFSKHSFINFLLFMQQRKKKTNTTHKERRLFRFTRRRYKEEIARNTRTNEYSLLYRYENMATREVIAVLILMRNTIL